MMEYGVFDDCMFHFTYVNDEPFLTMDIPHFEPDTNRKPRQISDDHDEINDKDLMTIDFSEWDKQHINETDTSLTLPEVHVTTSPRDLHQYIISKRNVNTQRKTVCVGKKFQQWLGQNGWEGQELTEITPEKMDTFVGHYILQCKKKNGEEYEPDSLTSIHRGIDRYLKDHGYKYSMVKDEHFSTSRKVLESKRKDLKSQGKGNKENRSEPLTKDEEELLWKKGQLGDYDPKVLLQTLWFLTTKHMGFRGSHESRQLQWGDISIKSDQYGECLSFRERNTKTRTGDNTKDSRPFIPKAYTNNINISRCPVRLFRKYETHHPEAMLVSGTPFYLAINNMRTLRCDARSWYKCSPLGIHSINNFMKEMCAISGISGKKTNHSIRKTTCTTLLHAGVPPTMIQQVAGHKNVSSINNYAVASKQQQKAMCDILAAEEKSNSAPSTAVATSSIVGNVPYIGNGNRSSILSPSPSCTIPAPTTSNNIPSSNSNPLGFLAGSNIQNCTFNISLNTVTKEDNTQSSQVVYNGPRYKRMRYNVIESDSDTD